MCTENHHWHHDYIRLAWDSGFTFNTHRAKSNLDWTSIGLLDLDRVVRDRDVASVEKYMGTVLNYVLDEEQTRILEPTFVKVFQISQLSVQYLQFCKRYLDNTVILLKKELGRYKQENKSLHNNVDELKIEVTDLKKKVKELTQNVQPPSIDSDSIVSPSFKCGVCSKMFVTEDFLKAHCKRRHETDLNPFQTETNRLQLEIKELKERLNSTEKYIQSDTNTKVNTQQNHKIIPDNDAVIESNVHVDDLKGKFDNLKQFVERELIILRSEKNYQEKYEKWFEIVFQRLDTTKNELQERHDKVDNIKDNDKLNQKESSTQTAAQNYVESETMTDEDLNVLEGTIKAKSFVKEVNVEKIQNDIEINTVNHLDQMQGMLEQKLSGGFEQLQTQMNTFWKRLSDMELEKKQNENNFLPVQAKKIIDTKPTSNSALKSEQNITSHFMSTGSSSESLEKPMVIKSQPVPAPRVVKKLPVIKYSKPKDKINASPVKEVIPVRPKITQKPEESSSENTSSDEEIKLVKAPVHVVPAKTTVVNARIKVNTKASSARRYARAHKKVISESETEEESLKVDPQVKQSNTSTLGQRSLTSLKQIMKDEEVIKGLHNELHEMINSRLQEIGVSPHWKRLPEKSYQQAMRVVKHQTEMSKKKYNNYNKIRETILKILNDKLRKRYKSAKHTLERMENKVLVIKQPIVKRQTKQQKGLQHSSDNLFITEIQSNDSQTKLNEMPKKETTEDKEHVPSNVPQEKISVVVATPIKKKVLFDLEDSSSTSKPIMVSSNVTTPQRQQSIQEDKRRPSYQQPTVVPSPFKKVDVIEAAVAPKTPAHKAIKINDGGSTTSLTSSILEAPKSMAVDGKAQNATKDDISDWDISDILT